MRSLWPYNINASSAIDQLIHKYIIHLLYTYSFTNNKFTLVLIEVKSCIWIPVVMINWKGLNFNKLEIRGYAGIKFGFTFFTFRRNLKVRRFIFRELPFKDKFRKENRLLRCTKFHRCSVSHNFKLHRANDEGTGHPVFPGLTSNRRFENVNSGCLIWTGMLWIFALANEWDQSNLNSVPFYLVISRLVISDSEHLRYSLYMYCITLSHCTFNTCIRSLRM